MKLVFTILILFVLHNTVCAQVSRVDPTLKVKVYYNTTSVSFELPKINLKTCSFEIYNFLGRKMYSVKSNLPNFINPNIFDYQKGFYIYKLIDNRNGQTLDVGKFLVAK